MVNPAIVIVVIVVFVVLLAVLYLLCRYTCLRKRQSQSRSPHLSEPKPLPSIVIGSVSCPSNGSADENNFDAYYCPYITREQLTSLVGSNRLELCRTPSNESGAENDTTDYEHFKSADKIVDQRPGPNSSIEQKSIDTTNGISIAPQNGDHMVSGSCDLDRNVNMTVTTTSSTTSYSFKDWGYLHKPLVESSGRVTMPHLQLSAGHVRDDGEDSYINVRLTIKEE